MVTTYIFNIINTAKYVLLSPIRSTIVMPPPHFPQDQGIECMPIITSEKIKKVSIRFPKWTFDTKTVQYAECRVKWQKYKGDIYHKSNKYFGKTKEDSRLTQVFFITFAK